MKLAALALCAACAAAAPRPLFNGRDLTGWVQHGPNPSFSAAQGELRISGQGQAPNWIHSRAEFEDFRLTFDYKLAQWTEAAVILRAPATDRPQHAGLTLVLAHDFHNQCTAWVSGALAGVLPPRAMLPVSFSAWHQVAIELRGRTFKASIDGALVQEVNLDEHEPLRHRLRRGVIGFPDLGHAYALRNLSIEDLGAPTRFIDLLPAASLEGWQLRGGGAWRLDGGTLTGADGHGVYYPPGVFGDFELAAAVRTHRRVNSGIFLRGDPTGVRRGFEVQIYSPVDSVYPTGSVYGRSRSRLSADLEGRWFLLQIRVAGPRVAVWVDGEPVAEYVKLSGTELEPGRVGLQIHLDQASVEFRQLRLRRLD
jgi:hypothetical protein